MLWYCRWYFPNFANEFLVTELVSSLIYFSQVEASNLTFKKYTNSQKCELPVTFHFENTSKIIFLVVIFKIYFLLACIGLQHEVLHGKAFSDKLILQKIIFCLNSEQRRRSGCLSPSLPALLRKLYQVILNTLGNTYTLFCYKSLKSLCFGGGKQLAQ